MKGRHDNRLARGAVYVEFLIVIWPMLLLFFGLAHIGLMYGAHLLVGHAAARAARAAIVILPDEQSSEYADVEVNRIGTGGEGLDAYKEAPEGGRLDQIRMAARLTLSPISPSIESYTGDSLADAIGDHPVSSTFVNLLGPWTQNGVAVTFPGEDDEYLTEFSARQHLKTRVTYLYKCSVPIIRSLVCDTYNNLNDTAKQELEAFGADGLIGSMGWLMGWRFMTMTEERTLPNQGKT